MRISEWSSDVCSSDLVLDRGNRALVQKLFGKRDVLQPVALDDEPRFQGACGAALRVSTRLRRVSSIASTATAPTEMSVSGTSVPTLSLARTRSKNRAHVFFVPTRPAPTYKPPASNGP